MMLQSHQQTLFSLSFSVLRERVRGGMASVALSIFLDLGIFSTAKEAKEPGLLREKVTTGVKGKNKVQRYFLLFWWVGGLCDCVNREVNPGTLEQSGQMNGAPWWDIAPPNCSSLHTCCSSTFTVHYGATCLKNTKK